MRVLRHLVGAVGFDPNSFSSHSFRRGGTTYAFQAGVPAPLNRHINIFQISGTNEPVIKFLIYSKQEK